jgi:hypothetical protein
MKNHIFLLAACFCLPSFANGRQPCDRGAGGVAYCVGEKFRCNNGKISGSKKICDPEVYGANGKTRAAKSNTGANRAAPPPEEASGREGS